MDYACLCIDFRFQKCKTTVNVLPNSAWPIPILINMSITFKRYQSANNEMESKIERRNTKKNMTVKQQITALGQEIIVGKRPVPDPD